MSNSGNSEVKKQSTIGEKYKTILAGKNAVLLDMENIEIHSLQKFLEVIEKLKTNYNILESSPLTYENADLKDNYPSFIYRGHSDFNYTLLPGVFRTENINGGWEITQYSQQELNILYNFISESNRYINDVQITDLKAWLEIAQHFSVPTRLLDFTQNPLVALFFACSENQDKTGSVWIINKTVYNKITFGEFYPDIFKIQIQIDNIINEMKEKTILSNYSEQLPVIYTPAYHEERMTNQSSVFMIWGSNGKSLESIVKKENIMLYKGNITNQTSGFILNLIVPSKYKRKLIIQLNDLAINEKFIFPGLDGVGKYIRSKYYYKNI